MSMNCMCVRPAVMNPRNPRGGDCSEDDPYWNRVCRTKPDVIIVDILPHSLRCTLTLLKIKQTINTTFFFFLSYLYIVTPKDAFVQEYCLLFFKGNELLSLYWNNKIFLDNHFQRMFIKYCVFFSIKCCDFSKLCQFCFNAGVLPTIQWSNHEVRCTH